MSSLSLRIHRQLRSEQLKLWSMKINPQNVLRISASNSSKTRLTFLTLSRSNSSR